MKSYIIYLNEVHHHIQFLTALEGIVQAHNERMSDVGENGALRLRSLHLGRYRNNTTQYNTYKRGKK
jgi:hypothetical protein